MTDVINNPKKGKPQVPKNQITDAKKYERNHKICIDGVYRWINNDDYLRVRRILNI